MKRGVVLLNLYSFNLTKEGEISCILGRVLNIKEQKNMISKPVLNSNHLSTYLVLLVSVTGCDMIHFNYFTGAIMS